MKHLALLTVALLVVTPAVAQAGSRPTSRTVTWDYQGATDAPDDLTASVVIGHACVSDVTCFDLTTEKYERLVRVHATDKSGTPIGVALSVVKGEDGTVVCGTGVIAVGRGETVSVHTVVTPACPAVPTTGTITFTVTGKR